MLTDQTRTIAIEALECLKHHAGHHEYIGNNTHQWMPDLAKRAVIDAAITELKAEAQGEWLPLADGVITQWLKTERDIIWIKSAGTGASIGAFLPDHIRLCQRVIGSQEATDVHPDS